MKQLGNRKVWSLREVSLAVVKRFEDIRSCWVEAEVSNLRAGGQMMYFSLADDATGEKVLIDGVMKSILFERLTAKPINGTLVHAYGRVEYWAGRNQVRFRVERLEFTGDGQLRARIEELRRQLDADGLTDPGRKRPVPFLPRRIGLVTSGDGAARADVLTNLTVRFPPADVLLVQSLVQGSNAPAELARAVAYLDALPDVDVIIVARGGGSLEDLMAFNSEVVCRAVAAAQTPIVSAVGHETDTTLCDLVADLRVSTPTKAAEAVVPDYRALVAQLERGEATVRRALVTTAEKSRQGLTQSADRLVRALRARGRLSAAHADASSRRLAPALQAAYRQARDERHRAALRLERAAVQLIDQRRTRIEHLAGVHGLLSPARTVARGYAIVRSDVGAVVTDAQAISVRDRVSIEFRDGSVGADVTSKE